MDEIPESILEQAREELFEAALAGLNEDTVADALTDDDLLRLIVIGAQTRIRVLEVGVEVLKTVHKYISPSEEEIQRKAAEILAERDYQNGKRT